MNNLFIDEDLNDSDISDFGRFNKDFNKIPDEDMIKGLKCRKCGFTYCKDEMIYIMDKTGICFECDMKRREYKNG